MDQRELSRLTAGLRRQRDRIDDLKPLNSESPDYEAWRTKTMELVRRAGVSEFVNQFSDIFSVYGALVFPGESPEERRARERPYYLEKLESARALLTSLIETLEELGPTPPKREVSVKETMPDGVPAATVNVSVVTQVVNQLAIQSNFVLLADEIKALPLTDEQKAEGAKMLGELEQEIRSASPRWDRIKTIVKWLIDHAWEVFIKVIPHLLEAYARGRGIT